MTQLVLPIGTFEQLYSPLVVYTTPEHGTLPDANVAFHQQEYRCRSWSPRL